MRRLQFIVILLSVLLLAACGTKKKVVQPSDVSTQPEVPAWHTCLIQNARATVITGSDKISATVTMQTVRDSMLIISIMPMLGIELVRLEATPTEFIGIDKVHARYAQGTYGELNKKVTPALNWDTLQQLCTAELPTGNEKAHLAYTLGKQTFELIVEYPERKLDVPVRMNNLRLDKYTKVDISKWL